VTKESCEENPYSVWVAALASTTVMPFAVDHLQVDQSVFCSLSVLWVPRPTGQPLAPADGRIANSMLMAVIMVLLLQRHLVRGIALTSFGGR
jgi:hypothetical protein